MDTRIFEEPKIDCHVHVLDPVRFPYGAQTHYAPAGQEMGTPAQLAQVMDAYGTGYALLVGPNSGYGLDNRCMSNSSAISAAPRCAERPGSPRIGGRTRAPPPSSATSYESPMPSEKAE